MAFLNHLASLVVNIVVNTKQFNTQINSVNAGLNGVVKNAAKFYLLRAAFLTVSASMQGIIKNAAELEQGFINIERVARQLKNTGFRKELAGLASNLPGVGLRELQEALKVTAQLGIQGKKELLEFGKQVTMLSSVTGISAGKLAEDLGKISTVFKIDPSNISHIINAVLQLSDNMVATEEEILDITKQLGAFAEKIGLSAEETAAFAATLKQVGVSTEQSRTALFKLFGALFAHPGKVAEAFNLTNEQVKQLFITLKQNPAGGIQKFLEMLQGRTAGQMVQALEKIGIAGRNNALALIALADNVDLLDEAIKTANEGSEDNVRLLQQMNDNAEGLTAKLTDLADAWERFLAALGNSQAIKDVIDDLTSMLELINDALNQTANVSTKVNTNDPTSIKNRISQLKAEQQAWEEWANKTMNAPWYEKYNPINHGYNTGKILTGATDEKTRNRELSRLKELLKKLETPKDEKTKSTSTPKRDTPEAATKEFNELMIEDQKKKRGRQPRERFQGFMGLDEAWKNKLLDKQANAEKQFKKLDDIFKENKQQNGQLVKIHDVLKNKTFPAVMI